VGKEEGDKKKRSHEGFKTSALDRTRAKPCTVCVEMGLYARTHVSEFECKPVSAIERIVVRSITGYRNLKQTKIKINKANKFIQTTKTNKKNKK
jgi:hypothetical protein